METKKENECRIENSFNKTISKSLCTHGYQPVLVEQASDIEDRLEALRNIADRLLYGLEIIQSVQNMNLTVPLVGNKPTLTRAYLKYRWPLDVKISGVIRASWRANAHSSWISRTVSSANFVKVKANSVEPLNEQRKDLQKSLNFFLPEVVTHPGECRIRLERLEIHLVYFGRSFKLPINIPTSNTSERIVQFQQSSTLRLQMIGIRYQNTQGSSFEPSGTDYALIQSWLKRAYPIANLSWSLKVVDAPQVWPFQANTINAFIRGIRRQDIQNGTDARTHYYGLVSDGGGFMRGLASGIPNQPDPSTVASGPTGPNWSWDTDGSFGDWYTGHELGHTLGRFHAEFCGAGGGRPYPFENGQLSNADEEFVGFDYGDLSNNIPQQRLSGTVWHDVMTYCDNQWLSSFTYQGIYDRLIAEDNLPSGASSASSPSLTGAVNNPASGSIHVLATINLTKKSGNLQHVIASNELSPDYPTSAQDQTPDLKLRLYRKEGQLAGEYLVNYFPDICLEEDEDETGIVDVVIPSDPDGSTLELLLDGETINTFTRTATANAVQNIRSVASTSAEASLRGLIPETFTIQWTDESSSSEAGLAAVPKASPGIYYVVKISKDGGETWQTVGYGQDLTMLEADPSFLEDVDQIKVRVTSTDGFTCQTTTQTLEL